MIEVALQLEVIRKVSLREKPICYGQLSKFQFSGYICQVPSGVKLGIIEI